MAEPTHFAPAERSTPEELHRAASLIEGNPVVATILQTFGSVAAVLDRNRQIVAANDNLLQFWGVPRMEDVFGLRPGEATCCVHATDSPGGCGTSEFCSTCGAVIAIVLSQENGEPAERECLLATKKGDSDLALELGVRAVPFLYGEEQFTILLLQDIRDKKRKEVLEQVFFHDLMNTMTGLKVYTERFRAAVPEGHRKIVDKIDFFTSKLIEEVKCQRLLSEVEAETYQVKVERSGTLEVSNQVRNTFTEVAANLGCLLEVVTPEKDETIETDQTLLYRVLGNMVTNAIESTPKQGVVRFWCEASDDAVGFKVWNEKQIPKSVSLRIFQRYFSTKGEPGRGLGTYSMKLLGEGFLRGTVMFTSSRVEGTVFTLRLPRRFPA